MELVEISVESWEAIRKIIKFRKISVRNLSSAIGIVEQSVSKMLSGNRTLTEKTLSRMTKVLGIPFEMVQYSDGLEEYLAKLTKTDPRKEYGIYSSILLKLNDESAEGEQEESSARVVGIYDPDLFAPVRIVRHKVWASFVDNFDEFNFDDVQDTVQVYLPDLNGPLTEDHMVFEILGDSMETTLVEKAKVLAELIDDGNIEYLNGGVYIIAYRNKLVAKRIIDNDLLTNGTLTLHSDNKERGKITILRDDIRFIWHVTDIIGSKVK